MPLDEVFVGDPHSAAHNEEREFINDLLAKVALIDQAVADADLSVEEADSIRVATIAVRDAAVAAASSAAGSATSAAASAALAQLISQIDSSDDIVNAILKLPTGKAATTLAVAFLARRDGLTWPSGNGPHKGGLYIFEGDSLTAGAAGGTWRHDFERSARGALGDGGPGFHLFTNGQRVDRGANAGWSGYGEFAIGDGSTEGGLFWGGLRSTADNASFGWAPAATRWDAATFFYLIKPGGGTFTLRIDRSTETYTVNTGTLNADGTGGNATDYKIGSIPIANPGGAYCELIVNSNVGSVVILGADFRNTRNPSGFRYGSLAAGGLRLSQFAAMRDDLRRQFFALITPAVSSINLGMNDRGISNAATHQAQLDAIVNAIRVASPNTGVWIVQSGEPGDTATTNFLSYTAAKKTVALARGAAFYDERTVLGNFAAAQAAGYDQDGVHPSAAGNARLASGLLTAMGIPAGIGDPGPEAFSANGHADPARGVLAQKVVTVAASTPTTLYTLGAGSNGGSYIVEIEVHGLRTGTSAQSLQTFRVLVQNGTGGSTSGGTATIVGPVNSTDLYKGPAPGDNGLQSATITAAIVNGKAVLTLTAAYGGKFVATGRWVSLNNGSGVSGRRIWEF